MLGWRLRVRVPRGLTSCGTPCGCYNLAIDNHESDRHHLRERHVQVTSPAPLFFPRPRRVGRAFLMPFVVFWLGWMVISSATKSYDNWIWWIELALLVLAVHSGVVAWVGLIWNRRVGLLLDEGGVTDTHATVIGPRARSLRWTEITGVNWDKGALIFVTRGTDHITIKRGALDEDPRFVQSRAQARLDALAGRGEAEVEELGQIAVALEAALCVWCDAPLATHVGETSPRCTACGRTDAASPSVKGSLAALTAALRALPAERLRVHDAERKRLEARVQTATRVIGQSCTFSIFVWSVASFLALSMSCEEHWSSGPRDSAVLFFALAMLALFVGRLAKRYVLALARRFEAPFHALAPVEPSGPARCRVCGAALPEIGVVRRCGYCNAESLVTGAGLEATSRSAASAARAAVREATEATTSAARVLERTTKNLARFAASQVFWLELPILLWLGHALLPLWWSFAVACLLGMVGVGFDGYLEVRRIAHRR